MLSAIVLAAGQVTRFGGLKQLVVLGEKPLLQHVLDNLAHSKIDDVVVVLGAHAGEIREQTQFGKARTILNPDYANGMSTSIQAGLRAIDAEAAIIVLADQPFVAARTFGALIDEYRRVKPSIVIPTFNGLRGNPVIVDRFVRGASRCSFRRARFIVREGRCLRSRKCGGRRGTPRPAMRVRSKMIRRES